MLITVGLSVQLYIWCAIVRCLRDQLAQIELFRSWDPSGHPWTDFCEILFAMNGLHLCGAPMSLCTFGMYLKNKKKTVQVLPGTFFGEQFPMPCECHMCSIYHIWTGRSSELKSVRLQHTSVFSIGVCRSSDLHHLHCTLWSCKLRHKRDRLTSLGIQWLRTKGLFSVIGARYIIRSPSAAEAVPR